jgi:hypothetical protein
MKKSKFGLLLAATCLWSSSCSKSEPPHVTPGATAGTPKVVGQSWDVCALVGPQRERPGIYGTDLGITVPTPVPSAEGQPQLAMLFGDSWAAQTDACAYPVMKADDLFTFVPAQRPNVLVVGQPQAAAAAACGTLQYPLDNPADATTWPRIHVYKDPLNRSPDNQLDTGMLRTPVAAWTDGQHTFGAFVRDESARCSASSDCPSQMVCSTDPAYTGKKIGSCQPNIALTEDADPKFCLTNDDCPDLNLCADLVTGVCLATAPFTVERNGQQTSPSWYADDPRRAIALRLYLATALWPDRASDYGTGFRFVTNKFVNVTARTITRFDPANPANNDYTPGTDTLLMWGRPSFAATKGLQSFPFLLYQPLAGLLDEQGNLRWAPKFFAGYDEAGNPRWSDVEADAQPVYGIDENLIDHNGQLSWSWKKPEFDYVEQMSTAWIAPLQRWVMIYGGDPPAYIVADPKSGEKLMPAHAQSIPGAMYLRSAAHPWGRATRDANASQAFEDARPVLTRDAMAKYLACDDDMQTPVGCSPQTETHDPDDLLSALGGWTTQLTPDDWLSVTATCLGGNTALGVQNSLGDDSAGHLYGANIIEEWTDDVSASVSGLKSGQNAVELYWNVSTWNPYSVVLVKTQLRGNAERLE